MRRQRKEPPFGKILQELMAEKGMSVSQAARVAGCAPSTICDWRAGRSPADFIAVKKLAAALGASLSFLLTGEEEAVGVTAVPPTVTQVFANGGLLYDGFARITIQKLIPRAGLQNNEQEKDRNPNQD